MPHFAPTAAENRRTALRFALIILFALFLLAGAAFGQSPKPPSRQRPAANMSAKPTPGVEPKAEPAPVVPIDPNAPSSELLYQMLSRKGDFALAILEHPRPGALAFQLSLAAFILFALYGAAMGLPHGWLQGFASAAKAPLVFLASLLVCLPALATLNVLVGAGMRPMQTLALILFALTLNAVLLASLAPIAWFFGVGSRYHFMKLLHVLFFAVCGCFSMWALLKGIVAACESHGLMAKKGVMLFQLWIVVYGFVGTQMGWVLRPFIGAPGLPFQWRRPCAPGLNFWAAVAQSLRRVWGDPERSTREAPGFSASETQPAAAVHEPAAASREALRAAEAPLRPRRQAPSPASA